MSDVSETTPRQILTSDAPIESASQDRLARSSFAKNVAHAISGWKDERSVVLALYGPWGSGKTSLVNLVVEELEKEGDEAGANGPIVVRFNPWRFTSSEQILNLFFGQLLSELGTNASKLPKGAKDVLEKYGDILTSKTIWKTVFGFIPGGGAIAEVAQPIAEAAVKLLRDGILGSTGDVENARTEVDKVFKQMESRVVIVIDDLDRLSSEEIRMVFQLVKLNANFPNVIYLLAGAREVLEKSVSTEQGISGREYLEKIVQAGFDIPMPDPALMDSLFFEQANEILSHPEPFGWDNSRWESIYEDAIRPQLKTLRSAKRFLSSLEFSYEMLARQVNGVDIVALEFIRLFAPEVYARLSVMKDELATGFSNSSSSFFRNMKSEQQRVKDVEQLVADLLDGVDKAIRPRIRIVLNDLFPQLRISPGQNHVNHVDSNEMRAQKRVASGMYFNYYFQLDVPTGAVSADDLETLNGLLMSGDLEVSIAFVQQFVEDGRARQLLLMLEDELPNLKNEALTTLLPVMMWLQIRRPSDTSALAIPIDITAERILGTSLKLMTPQERRAFMEMEIAKPESLGRILRFLRDQDRIAGTGVPYELPADELVDYRTGALAKMNDVIRSHPELLESEIAATLHHWHTEHEERKAIEDAVDYLLGDIHRTIWVAALFLPPAQFAESHPMIRQSSIQSRVSQLETAIPLERIASVLAPKQRNGIDFTDEEQEVLAIIDEYWDRFSPPKQPTTT